MSATYADGYRAVAVCPVIGPRAVEKAQKVAEAIIKRYVVKTPHFSGLPSWMPFPISQVQSVVSCGYNLA